MCITEAQCWTIIGILAVIFAASCQLPFIASDEVTIEGASRLDVFHRISEVNHWDTWCTALQVLDVRTQDDDVMQSGLVFTLRPPPSRLSMDVPVRVTVYDQENTTVCWVWERVWPLLYATHCHNVTLDEGGGGAVHVLNTEEVHGMLWFVYYAHDPISHILTAFNKQLVASFAADFEP
eukprot:CAMPEP_0198338236 /NCGR_PEP_ID=MMETSP1450-20131203/34319_1 /TAXON_ID=753684 ORGANISM="Madagascaria erythrocladiodes, Strain CCMP3234" /NCGR_SAMPLE_ID=MMETSP1450 /ASSEMBLY_ACC=CAM_ASM_001115 /LENGTH=178 /DNA_ID=CAMNT_0044043099 /DNA_START=17 /DNA_END=550 /DNA_ORIENTATION=-